MRPKPSKCLAACPRARAIEEMVLLPPVETVKERTPIGLSAYSMHCSYTLWRCSFTGVFAADCCNLPNLL